MNILKVIIFCLICVGCFSVRGRSQFAKWNFENEMRKLKDQGPGDPLFLTDYLEKGDYATARKLSYVPNLTLSGSVSGHAGYLRVNKEYNSNIFFWLFESENNKTTDPTVIWLQGGPGSSSLFGLFNENGPYIITDEGGLTKRSFSWSSVANLIYFDSPVGTGFSFTEDERGYAKDQKQVGKDLLNALLQLDTIFPFLQKSKLYITGESYAGKYVPALAFAIHKNNRIASDDLQINLKGLMIGNGFTDPINMLKYGDYLHELGLIDNKARSRFHKIEKQIKQHIVSKEWKRASEDFDKLVGDEGSLYYKYTGLTSYYNYYNLHSGDWEDYEQSFVEGDFFRRSVHVGNKTYNDGSRVYKHLYEDVPKSVIDWLVQLLDHYDILLYNGQLDIICAYPLTENYLWNMKWKLSDEYKNAKRFIYRVGDDIAGYYKNVGHLTEMVVRNAGHMVPADQPEWTFNLLQDFIKNRILIHRQEISPLHIYTNKHGPY